MITDLKKHYQTLLQQHGFSPKSVQHIDRKSQYKRFEILCEIDLNASSIIDVGCGLGDMYQYLQEKNFLGKYLGVDFLPDFIKLSSERFNKVPQASFSVCDLEKDKLPLEYDYIFLSGVFNNKLSNNESFMRNTINKMFASCNKGIAFNAMSTYVDYQDPELYYSNPLEIFDFCKRNLTKNIVLRHEYIVKENSIPFEYTIYLYKEPM
jgi:SAM-dependent methyltransferase